MNLLVLLAGSNDKYQEAGQVFPKNLVEIAEKPIIEHVVENLRPVLKPGDRPIMVLRREENLRYHTDLVVRLLVPDVHICEVGGKTAGAACSALLAINEIDNEDALLIANGDQIITASIAVALADFARRDLDGGILVFEGVHPRWSFVRCNADGLVVETAEKRPISRLATAGLYYFRHGRDFVRAAQKMVLKDAQVGGAFFVCPAYNELLLEGARIGVHLIPRHAYHSLATPQDAQVYTEHLKARAN